MATLKSLNKIISTTSQELNSTTSRDAILNNSRRTRNDINRLSNFTNRVVVEALKSLTSGELYPHDTLQEGIAGNTIITHLISCGNNANAHEAYWLSNGVSSRPKTIKETFDYIIANLNATNIVNNFNQGDERINDAFDLINCNFNYIRKISAEVLGKKYEDLLSCNNPDKSYTFTLGTHLYNVLSQLTLGLDADLIAPYNQEEEGLVYPNLEIPFSRISGRIETLAGLTDTSVETVADGQIIQWSADINSWVNKDLPGAQQIEEIADIGDVSDVEGQEGQVLRLRSDVWTPEDLPNTPTIDNLSDIPDVDNTAATPGQVLRYRNDAWTPEDLPADEKIEYIKELRDVDTTHAPVDNDLLVWDSTHQDNTNNDMGAWVPKSVNELGLNNGSGGGSKSTFEGTFSGPFSRTVNYSNSGYTIEKGSSPLIFIFRNTYGSQITVKDFTFTCGKMYSSHIGFSFVKFTHEQLLSKNYESISDEHTVEIAHVDTALNLGAGSLEGSLDVNLNGNQYIGVLINTIQKTSADIPDEMFFITIEVEY